MPSRSSAASATELAEELGIDPSPALVELEQRILAQDPELLGAPSGGEPLRGYRLGERLGTGRDGTVRAAHAARRRPRARGEDGAARARRRPGVHPELRGHRAPGRVAAPPGRRTHPRLVARARRRLRGDAPAARRHAAATGCSARRCLVARSSRWSSGVGGALSDAAALGLVHGRVTVDNVLYDGFGRAGPHRLLARWSRRPRSRGRRARVRGAGRPGACRERRLAEVAGLLASPDGMHGRGADRAAADRARRPRATRRPRDATRTRACGRSTRPTPRTTSAAPRSSTRCSAACPADGAAEPAGAAGRAPPGRASPAPSGPACCPGCAPAGRTGSDAWFVATMLPGGAPFKELAESLRGIAVGDTAGLAAGARGRRRHRPRPEGAWFPRAASCCW